MSTDHVLGLSACPVFVGGACVGDHVPGLGGVQVRGA